MKKSIIIKKVNNNNKFNKKTLCFKSIKMYIFLNNCKI